MPLAALLCLALLAGSAAAQEAGSPFIVNQDALDRRYGVGGDGGEDAPTLPPAEGAEPGGSPWNRTRDSATRERAQPGAVGSDVVDESGVLQRGQRPFIRF